MGSKTDSVSADQLKPVLSEFPVTAQDPLAGVDLSCLQKLWLWNLWLWYLWLWNLRLHHLQLQVYQHLFQEEGSLFPPVPAESSVRRNPRRVVRDKHLVPLQVLKMLRDPCGGARILSSTSGAWKPNQIYRSRLHINSCCIFRINIDLFRLFLLLFCTTTIHYLLLGSVSCGLSLG